MVVWPGLLRRVRDIANPKQAEAAFTALTDALKTCTGETYEGSQLAYAVMSAPDVGDGSVGVRISADNYTVLQNFALIGPTLVSTGGGGLVSADADQIATVLQTQATAYTSAATN